LNGFSPPKPLIDQRPADLSRKLKHCAELRRRCNEKKAQIQAALEATVSEFKADIAALALVEENVGHAEDGYKARAYDALMIEACPLTFA
jgi:hypothetical protein